MITAGRIGIGLMVLALLTFTLTFAQDAPGYSVEIDPANFVAIIDNPYLPLIAGTRWTYEGQTAEGLEHTEIEVLAETRLVMGITATVVRDTVYLDGVIREDTYD